MSEFTPDKNDITKVNGMDRHVVCAANKFPCGTIICGARHWDEIMCNVADQLGLGGGKEEQGFIDQWQNFITREDATKIVLANGQSLRETPLEGDILVSENLY